MFKELLEKNRTAPCLRADYKEEREIQENLFRMFRERYPNLLSDVDPLNHYVPRGWVHIIDNAFRELEQHGAKLIQVKQKLGSLRLYIRSWVDQECDEVIWKAEDLAKITCEFCQSKEDVSLFDSGYICRVCKDCRTILCETVLMHWALNGESEELDTAGKYCVAVLRGKKNSEIDFMAGCILGD